MSPVSTEPLAPSHLVGVQKIIVMNPWVSKFLIKTKTCPRCRKVTNAVLESNLGNIRLLTKPGFGGAERRKFSPLRCSSLEDWGSGRDSAKYNKI